MQQFDLSKIDQKIGSSKYFTWREALWLPSVEAIAIPSLVQQQNIIKQAEALDKVREYFGRPIKVHCWLRPPQYNKLVGGAPKSSHILGLATDFSIPGLEIDAIKHAIVADRLYNGRGEWDTTTWIHLDLTGPTWFYGRSQAI